jgi:hypothetical protein
MITSIAPSEAPAETPSVNGVASGFRSSAWKTTPAVASAAPTRAPDSTRGSLAMKKSAPIGQNSFPTYGPLFVTLLTVTILLVGGLTFLPTLALGPIAEHLSLSF